jgi:hypothetical protein
MSDRAEARGAADIDDKDVVRLISRRIVAASTMSLAKQGLPDPLSGDLVQVG